MKTLFWICSAVLMVVAGTLDFNIFGGSGFKGLFFTPCIGFSAILITLIWAKFYPKNEEDWMDKIRKFLS
jgi:hypothetical protein